MFARILSCINSLTISVHGLAGDLRLLAAQLLGLAAENGTIAAPLDDLAAEIERPAAEVLAVLQALAGVGLVVLVAPAVTVGDRAVTWIVCWWCGWAGDGAAVATGNVSGDVQPDADRADGGLFVCSGQSPDLSIGDIYNKQTNNTRGRARACEAAPAAGAAAAVVTGNVSGDKKRIAALLSDQAVTAGLLVRSSSAPVGAFPPDDARKLAAELVKAGRSFDWVLANVCEWRRQIERGDLFSPLPALRSRLARGFDGSITAADRDLDWFRRHSPDAYALPFAPGPDLDFTGNVSSDVQPVAVAVPAPASDWDRFLDALAGADPEVAERLAGSAAQPVADRWIVRLGSAGRCWLDWLQDRAARRVSRELSAFLGSPAPVAVEFLAGGD